MPRRALVILVLSGLLLAEAAEVAEALPKSFCRRWAAGVATRIMDENKDRLPPPVRAAESEAGPGHNPDKVKRLAGGGLGGTLARFGKSGDWSAVYKKAYAHCRVVETD